MFFSPKKRSVLVLLAFFGAASIHAQMPLINLNSPSDEIEIIEPRSPFYSGRKLTTYETIQRLIDAHLPITYLAPKPSFIPFNRSIPLRDGEGRDGYVLEANLDVNFPLMQGRNQSRRFWKTSRLSIRFAPILRLSDDEQSKPLMPINAEIGLRIDKTIWDSKYKFRGVGLNPAELRSINREELDIQKGNPFRTLNFTGYLAHFSNGMRESALYYPNEDSALVRNNYQDGDFSTNFMRFELTYSQLSKENELLSFSLGYQRDFGVPGLAAFTAEQVGRYGRNRVLGIAQFRTKPFRHRKKTYDWYDHRSNKMLSMSRLAEMRFRLENEIILDGDSPITLEQYGNQDRLWRNGTHLYAEYRAFKWRSVGLVAHAYVGRDYLNIRYDDPILAVMGGISISPQPYTPPRFGDYVNLEHPVRKIYLDHPGPEDFVVMKDPNLLLIAQGRRMGRKDRRYGAFSILDMTTDSVIEVEANEFNYQYAPLGIKRVKDNLYITNAEYQNESGQTRWAILSFRVDSKNNKYSIKIDKVLVDDLDVFVNNLYYHEDHGLFYSVFSKTLRKLSMALCPSGQVVWIPETDLEKINSTSPRKVIEQLTDANDKTSNIRYVNSFVIHNDILYVTCSREKFLLYYELTDPTQTAMRQITTVPLLGGDNIIDHGNGRILTTGTPRLLQAVRHQISFSTIVGNLIYDIQLDGANSRYNKIIEVDKEYSSGMISVAYNDNGNYYLGQIKHPYIMKLGDQLIPTDISKYTRKIKKQQPYIQLYRFKQNTTVSEMLQK